MFDPHNAHESCSLSKFESMKGPLLLGAPLDPFHVSKFYIWTDG
ncbi:MAG: hypothetical protein OJF50_004310 [Nitrospira sp.]|nr:hypothetical protein [Nitrospira sp.]